MAKALLCDGTAYVRANLRRILETAGHEVVGETASGKECVEMYKEARPDVVFVDITLSDIDGYEVTTQILEYDKDAIILFASALVNQESIRKAASVGAKDFITKPFTDVRVIASIDRYVLEKL